MSVRLVGFTGPWRPLRVTISSREYQSHALVRILSVIDGRLSEVLNEAITSSSSFSV